MKNKLKLKTFKNKKDIALFQEEITLSNSAPKDSYTRS